MKQIKKHLALLLALALLAALAAGCNFQSEAPQESGDPSSESTDMPSTGPALQGAYGENDATALDDYSVTEILPDDVSMSAVVAVDAEGNACLTNGDLQIYYWLEFYNFMNSYGSIAMYLGLDANLPLASQYTQENLTWEQSFLESAAHTFSMNYALAQAAYAAGYTLPEEEEAEIADFSDPNGEFAAQALESGYESVDAYLKNSFGDGVTVENYQNYVRTYYAASDYYKTLSNEEEASLTEDAVEAYYDENAASYEENRLLKVNNVSARHILIAPEGEKDAELNDWTEEQWADAEARANEVFALWQQDPTEENFAALANEYSTDGGSNTNGGLYEDFASDAMVTEFSDWCFDQARVEGDTGIVRTPYGYHIMYFVGQTETRAWFDTAKEDMLSDRLDIRIDEMIALYPVSFDYTQVRLFDLITKLVGAENGNSAE